MFSDSTIALVAAAVVIAFFSWIGYELHQADMLKAEKETRQIITKIKVKESADKAEEFTETGKEIKAIYQSKVKGETNETIDLSIGKHSITFGN